jgi:hypothetical protein
MVDDFTRAASPGPAWELTPSFIPRNRPDLAADGWEVVEFEHHIAVRRIRPGPVDDGNLFARADGPLGADWLILGGDD